VRKRCASVSRVRVKRWRYWLWLSLLDGSIPGEVLEM